jgi:hypothetical protein
MSPPGLAARLWKKLAWVRSSAARLANTTLAPALALGTRTRSSTATPRNAATSARAPAIRAGRSGNHTTGLRSISRRSRSCSSCAAIGTAPNEPWLRCRWEVSSDHAAMAGRPSARSSGRGAVVTSVSGTALLMSDDPGDRYDDLTGMLAEVPGKTQDFAKVV